MGAESTVCRTHIEKDGLHARGAVSAARARLVPARSGLLAFFGALFLATTPAWADAPGIALRRLLREQGLAYA